MKLYVTLKELKKFRPCRSSMELLLAGIEFEDATKVCIPLTLILDVLDSDDLGWLLAKMDNARLIGVNVYDEFCELLDSAYDAFPVPTDIWNKSVVERLAWYEDRYKRIDRRLKRVLMKWLEGMTRE